MVQGGRRDNRWALAWWVLSSLHVNHSSHLAGHLGSALHSIRALTHPRWEDYNYARVDKIKNRMYWLGDGSTWNEKTMAGDRKLFFHEYLFVSDVC